MRSLCLGCSSGPLQILCLGAHCDDIEIGCGGSLLRLLDEHPGAEVSWFVLSSNPEREREARASAAEFLAAAGNTTIEIRTFRESYFPYHGDAVKDFFEEIKARTSPDLVFSHHRRDDGHAQASVARPDGPGVHVPLGG